MSWESNPTEITSNSRQRLYIVTELKKTPYNFWQQLIFYKYQLIFYIKFELEIMNKLASASKAANNNNVVMQFYDTPA